MINESLKMILHQSELDIIDHNIHYRKTMNTINRTLPFFVMSYIKEGEACLKINGKEYETEPGTIVIIPPYTQHDHFKNTTNNTTFMWWHFNFKIIGMIDIIKVLQLPLISHLKNKVQFEKCFMKCYNLLQKKDSISDYLMQKSISFEMISVIFKDILSTENMQIPIVPDVFVNILNDVISLELTEVSLNSLASKYHLNTTYISNQFNKYYGIAPIALRRQITLQRAKKMLMYSNLSVAEIALELNFSSFNAFSRFFKNKSKLSPQQYRRKKW